MNKPAWQTWLYHAVSLALTLLFILPLIWMVSTSLRQPGLPPPRTIEWLPQPLAFSNYPTIFNMLPLGWYALNSLIVAALAIPITLTTASWAGLALSQLRSAWRGRFIMLSIGLLLVPITALWLTRFILFKWLGLLNTFGSLLAPALMGSSPLFVLLFYRAFRRMSPELFEAARLEGATALRLWWEVALPLARSTIAAVAVLTFLLYWSDFISPLLYLKSPSLYTLPVGLRQLEQMDKTNWPLLLAASVVMTAPAVGMFLMIQHYFLGEESLLER